MRVVPFLFGTALTLTLLNFVDRNRDVFPAAQAENISVTPATGIPTGAAGGDLSGTYPNPGVAKINGAAPAAIATSGSATDLVAGAVPAARMPALTGDVTSSAGSVATTLAAGSASNLNSGTLAAARLPALTGDVTSSAGGAATTLATGSASNLNSGTLAAARGGAGTISGALKGNGAGLVTQAACADLSNAATSCSTDATNAGNISAGTLAVARGGTGDTGTAWSTYTPTLTCGTSGTVSADTVSGRTKVLGKTIFFSINLNISTVGTCLGNLSISLQNTAQVSVPVVGYNASLGASVPAVVSAGGAAVALIFASAPAANIYWINGTYESQ